MLVAWPLGCDKHPPPGGGFFDHFWSLHGFVKIPDKFLQHSQGRHSVKPQMGVDILDASSGLRTSCRARGLQSLVHCLASHAWLLLMWLAIVLTKQGPAQHPYMPLLPLPAL